MITDVHVHLVGMREEDGCYVDPDLLSGLLFRYLMHSLGLSEVPEGRRSRAYREQLVAWVDESDIEAVGLLALDGIYDDGGRLDRERTKFVVSNDYCLEVAGDHDALVPICSVHPGRSDAIEELERVVRRGAAAIKLLPNSQDIDYCDDRFRPFWQRMARLGVPLLTHTSFEHTIPPVDQSLGHPERLEPVLDEGVTVIAAHCGSSGVGHWTEHY
ncbi:MAG: amidohydrolase family protein, partial [Bradymonadaceae bacterium]